jgi:hypothetical protein
MLGSEDALMWHAKFLVTEIIIYSGLNFLREKLLGEGFNLFVSLPHHLMVQA